MQTKEKLIRWLTINQPGAPTVAKRIFALGIFIIHFILATILLFQMNSIPTNIIDTHHYIWISSMIIVVWISSKIANYNLHISYVGNYWSSLFALILTTYTTVFVALNYQQYGNISSWIEYRNLLDWSLPIFCISLIWKITFIIIEKKSRPYFAWEQFWNSWSIIAVIFGAGCGVFFIDKFLIKNQTFNYLDSINLFFIITESLLILMAIIAALKSWKFMKLNKFNRESSRIVALSYALLRLGPTTIWFLAKSPYLFMSGSDIFYLITAIVIIIFTTVIASLGSVVGRSSEIFLLLSTTSKLILIIIPFVISEWFGANIYVLLSIMLPAILYIAFLNLLFEPKVSAFYSFMYNLLFSSLSLIAIIFWILGKYVGLENPDAYNVVHHFVTAPMLIIVITMEAIIVSSLWYAFRTIKVSSKRLINIKKEEMEISKLQKTQGRENG